MDATFEGLPTPKQVLDKPELQDYEMELCSRDFWFFALRWGKTKDPNFKPSVRPFPDKLHIRKLIDVLLTHTRILVKKSRRMQLTWTICMYSIWLCLFHDNQAVAIQSKDKDD